MRYNILLTCSFLLAFLPFPALAVDPPRPVGTASQGGDVPDTCQPEIAAKIEARAWTQGQEDVETVQNLRTKPDSVLEYTCFDQYVSVTAKKTGEIFSDADMTTDLGGLLGDDFFGSLLDGLLGSVLQELLPDELLDMMDVISGLNSADILMKLSPAELTNVMKNMSVEAQNELKAKILEELPPEARDELPTDIATRPLDDLVSSLDNLPPAIRDLAIPQLAPEELEAFLDGLPGKALDELTQGLGLDLGGVNENELNLDEALEATILEGMNSYLDSNFGGKFLGGRIDLDYDPSPSIGSGTYNCDRMNAVWQMAKCQNFQAIPERDGFKTLQDYANGPDPRQTPQACSKSPDWKGMEEASHAENEPAPTYAKELKTGSCADAKVIKGPEITNLKGEKTQQFTCSNTACTYKDGKCQ